MIAYSIIIEQITGKIHQNISNIPPPNLTKADRLLTAD
jgi:hypothetical protein